MVVDEELRRALARSERFLPDRSKAMLLRELAMRGADALSEEADVPAGLKRLLELSGVEPPLGKFSEFLENHVPAPMPAGAGRYAASRALREQREERM